jgi:hypothetical protein
VNGWGFHSPFFQNLIDQIDPDMIVEVGSWKGLSAINMGKMLLKKKSCFQIICVDTWLGTTTAWMDKGKQGINYLPCSIGFSIINILILKCRQYFVSGCWISYSVSSISL